MENDVFFAVQTSDLNRFQEAIRRFDQENAQDPNQEIVGNVSRPRELVYAERLSDWVMQLAPSASEELRLAARCQHIGRWRVPRNTYEMTRPGYLKWRSDLKALHARRAGEILSEVGYSEDVVRRVQDLNLKRNFPKDPESQVLEDALCLVFLQYQLAELAERTSEDKIISALQKSWKKMTPTAHAHALGLPFGPREKALVERALGG